MKNIKRFLIENEFTIIVAWGIIFSVVAIISLVFRIDWLFQILTIATCAISFTFLACVLVGFYLDSKELNEE